MKCFGFQLFSKRYWETLRYFPENTDTTLLLFPRIISLHNDTTFPCIPSILTVTFNVTCRRATCTQEF